VGKARNAATGNRELRDGGERVTNDRKLVVQAAAQAQKVSDFILGRGFEAKAEAGE